MFDQLAQVYDAPRIGPAPTITLQNGVGFKGDSTCVLQVGINFWNGRVTGAAHCKGGQGNWWRLTVTRATTLDEFQTDPSLQDILKRKVGRKESDHLLRKLDNVGNVIRFDAILRASGPYGLNKVNMAPWLDAMRQIETGIKWCQESALAHKDRAYGLLLVAELGHERLVNPTDERYAPYLETEIQGILAAEVCELELSLVAQAVKKAHQPQRPKLPKAWISELDD